MALDALWSESFPTRPRPQVYSSQEIGTDGYLPLTDTSDFLVDGLHGLTASQLYALMANNAEVLRQAQEEWTNLERLANQVKTQDHFSTTYKDPQALLPHDIFDERKEAILYNYKYEANRPMVQPKFTLPTITTDQEKFDLRESPNPFAQMIPNDKQHRSITLTAKNAGHGRNPDNQVPYEQNFALQARPAGTWIAKMATIPAVQPPRTRAREAQLNGAAGDRQTRFNGEKVPATRSFTSADELQSETATPIGSPASRKRKIETIDIALPRKKHPNQHTKRREREEAERLAALNPQQGLAISSEAASIASPVMTPRKKHPNQYTKRREQEESERLAQEMAGYYNSNNKSTLTASRRSPVSVVVKAYRPEKKKHPNQYTKRREQEKAERMAGQDNWNDSYGEGQHLNQWNQDGVASNIDGTSRHATPISPRPQAVTHPSRNIDFDSMTTAELRTFTFKDWELTAFLQDQWLWLNDDPHLAHQWKIKIENSAYAMRTYAMLKKWKEWASEGRDKRPRDKDRNKSKAANRKNHLSGRTDGEEADVESMADDPPNNSTDTASRPNSKIITLRRPVRARTSRLPFENGDSPKVMPSSPLVNGINARDLDKLDKLNDQAKIRSFTSTLQTIGEVDNATKVGRWRVHTVSDPVTEEVTTDVSQEPGTHLATPANLATHGTEDDIYPSTQSTLQAEGDVDVQDDADLPTHDRMDIDSEDPRTLPLHSHSHGHQQIKYWSSSSRNPKSQWMPDDSADTILVHEPTSTSPSSRGRNNLKRTDIEDATTTTGMPRARSQSSTYSNTITVSQEKKQVQTQKQIQNTSIRPRLARGTSGTATTTLSTTLTSPSKSRRATTPNPPSNIDTDHDFPSPHKQSFTGPSISTMTSGPTRRAGLRPNPVKRTLTSESLKMGVGVRDDGAPVRRSLRGSGVVQG